MKLRYFTVADPTRAALLALFEARKAAMAAQRAFGQKYGAGRVALSDDRVVGVLNPIDLTGWRLDRRRRPNCHLPDLRTSQGRAIKAEIDALPKPPGEEFMRAAFGRTVWWFHRDHGLVSPGFALASDGGVIVSIPVFPASKDGDEEDGPTPPNDATEITEAAALEDKAARLRAAASTAADPAA